MLRTGLLCLTAALTFAAPLVAGEPTPVVAPPAPLYELAVVRAAPGRLEALQELVRDHELPLLARHGLQPIGFFTQPGEPSDERLWCLYASEASPSDGARWDQLHADSDWKDSLAIAEADGTVVESADVQMVRTTPWSPALSIERTDRPRTFELRTYTCPDADRHDRLQRRFRDHTMGLFAKHGMHNVVYWLPTQPPAADRVLVYLLAHDSVDSARRSFADFRQDPAWIAAKTASEQEAGGSLTVKQNGVVSQFLEPTGFSLLR